MWLYYLIKISIIMTREKKPDTKSIIRDIKRKTYKKYSAEEKIRIVLEGLRGEEPIALY